MSALSTRTGAAGQNVTVAVLDSGIDPGAPGLQVTPDGQRKIVDLVDCTSSGDVNTLARFTLSENSTLRGFSGRTLHVPQSVVMRNKSGVYRLGIKRAYDFFPSALVRRIKKEREATWKRIHANDVSKARLLVHQLRAQGAPSANIDEAEARLSVLQGLSKQYRDPGPFFDCVVFHDGTNWLAIVDTSQRGRLEECDVLEDFAIRGSYSTFPDGVMLNFGVKIYSDGDILSIVADCSSHGTHVASILAANFPESPHLNGLAPAARIVSLKIGDSRLSGMETHQGLMRALAYCLAHSSKERTSPSYDSGSSSNYVPSRTDEFLSVPDCSEIPSAENTSSAGEQSDNKPPAAKGSDLNEHAHPSQDRKPVIAVDMINMSYGEHTRDCNKGRFVRLANELVHKHNVIFISSAGNEGPALSSVSAPGGTTDSIIGVGAYVTPDMITQAYSYLHSDFHITHSDSAPGSTDSRAFARSSSTVCQAPVVGVPYTWTSRGPSPDGAMSVSVCAPGGAIAPVPVWNLQRKQLMNGTSMSSPSAAGAVAVILAFLKQKGIPYTSALVRRAIENSARSLKPIQEATRHHESANDKSNLGVTKVGSDLVFATGCGSIDALAACNYIENYMAPRKSPQASTDALPIGATARAREHPECPDPKPLSQSGGNYTTTHENCGGSTFCLEDWHFKISVRSGSQSKRSAPSNSGSSCGTNGIYLRGTAVTECAQRIQVIAELTGYDEECDQTKKTLSEIEVHLALEGTASWVEVPKSLVFLGSERSFHVVVDPTKLVAGRHHFAEVLASVRHPGNGSVRSGPVFRVPVTVLKPEALLSGLSIRPWDNVQFSPGRVVRRFYESPCGATYAFIRVTAGKSFSNKPAAPVSSTIKTDVHTADGIAAMENGLKPCPIILPFGEASFSHISTTDTSQARMDEEPRVLDEGIVGDGDDKPFCNDSPKTTRQGHVRIFDMHVAQLLPQVHYGETETQQTMWLYPGAVQDTIAQLEGQSLFELCLAQAWSSPGTCCIKKVELIFGGVVPRPRSLHAQPGMLCFPRLEVASHIQSGMAASRGAMAVSGFSLRAVLSNLLKTVTPKTTYFQELSNEDFIVGFGPTYQLEIGYKFEMYESGKVTLLFPSLNRTVYESELEGGPYVIIHQDGNRFVSSSDIYPRGMDLAKGEYAATVYVRHESMDVLESISEMPMTVKYDLPSELNLDAFDSAHAACVGIDKRKLSRNTIQLEKGERIAAFLGIPKRSMLPKWAAFGDTMSGSLTVDKLVGGAGAGLSSRRGNELPTYNLTLSVGPASSPKPRPLTMSPSSIVPRSTDSNAPFSPPTDQRLCSKDDSSASEERADEVKSNVDTEPENEDSYEWECESSKWVHATLRKARVKQLKNYLNENKTENFLCLYEVVKSKHGEEVDILMLRLVHIDREACNKYMSNGTIEDIRKFAKEAAVISDRIRGKLDPSAIAAHFAFNLDADDREAAASRKSFEKKRQNCIEALFRKARALSLVAVLGWFGQGNESERADIDNFDASMKELGKWVTLDGKGHMPGMVTSGVSPGTTSDEDLAIVSARREAVRGRYGCALQILDQFYGPSGSKRPETLLALLLKIDVLRRLKWNHVVERECEYRLVRFPRYRMAF